MPDDRSMHDMAARLRAGLEAPGGPALGDLLDADVTWGDCAGRDDVIGLVEATTSAGARPTDVAVDVLDDRLVLSFRLGDAVHHQAVFVAGGTITEICDGADRDDATTLRPIGPLPEAAARTTAVTGVAPILAVQDLDVAMRHYRRLGFVVHGYEGEAAYAFAERDEHSLHLAEVPDLDPAENTSAVYLYVSDADALYARWRSSGAAGRLIAPVDTDYGLREGAHVDPDGNLLRFGSGRG